MVTTLGDIGAGSVLGRYELLVPVAKGGMAVVWAARMRGTRGFQKLVAIKTMLPTLSEEAQFEKMFLDEAQLASAIHHPNVAEILDLGEDLGVLYIVMEWVDGEPLQVLMKSAQRAGGLPLTVSVRVVAQVLAGLQAAHELADEHGQPIGLVHRDVSPQNILVTREGRVKIVDFGVAKAAGRIAADTDAGQLKGKVAYMAPEQASGDGVDRRTDVFAVGILLYLMTTGRHPFRGESDAQTIQNVCSPVPVVAPTSFVPGYPQPLEAVVKKALAKDPDARFASASEMLKALDLASPAAMTASTDEKVAELARSLLAERLERRTAAIREAQRRADQMMSERPPGVAPSPIDAARLSLAPSLSGVSGLTAITSTGTGSTAGSIASATSLPPPAVEPGPVTRFKWAIVGGAVAIGAVSAALLVARPPRRPTPVVAAPTPAEPVASELVAPAAPPSVAPPIASALVEPVATAAAAHRESSPAARASASASSTSAPKPPATPRGGYVPPIKDPGF